jgi:hypothetical protein
MSNVNNSHKGEICEPYFQDGTLSFLPTTMTPFVKSNNEFVYQDRVQLKKAEEKSDSNSWIEQHPHPEIVELHHYTHLFLLENFTNRQKLTEKVQAERTKYGEINPIYHCHPVLDDTVKDLAEVKYIYLPILTTQEVKVSSSLVEEASIYRVWAKIPLDKPIAVMEQRFQSTGPKFPCSIVWEAFFEWHLAKITEMQVSTGDIGSLMRYLNNNHFSILFGDDEDE